MIRWVAGMMTWGWMLCLLFSGIGCDGGGGDGNDGSTDITAPTVVTTSPANAASGVSINTAVSITFSEEMDASTITSATITWDQGVTGTVVYTSGVFTATFTPSVNLTANTTYTVTVSAFCEDTAGNPLAADYTWTFATDSSADTIPPQVSAVNPTDGATMVAVNADVTATFDENMDASTIVTANFRLEDGSGIIVGTVSYNAATHMATFTPASPLAGSTVYTATLETACRDTAGNGLVAGYTWSFTTGTSGGTWSSVGGQVSPATAESEDPTMLFVNGFPAVGYREASFQANLNVWNNSSWGTSVMDPTGNNMNYTSYHAPSYCSDGISVYAAYSFAGDSASSDDAFYDRVFARQWLSGNTWLTPMNSGEEISVKTVSPPGDNAYEPAIDCDVSGNVRVAWIEGDVADSVDDHHLWVATVTDKGVTRSSPLSRNNNTGSYGTDVISVAVATDASGNVYLAQWENHHNDQYRSDLYATRYGGGVFTNLGGSIADDYDRSFLAKPSIAFNGTDLYIAYSRANDTDYTRHVYVKKYDSGTWVLVGGGPVSAYTETDHYSSNNPDLIAVGSDLLVAWQESDQYEGPFIYAAKLSTSGAEWEIIGSKLNVNASREALDPSLYYDTTGQTLYIAFEEYVSGWPQIFVKSMNLTP